MPEKFDGCKVTQILFAEVPKWGRFFTDNGTGYCKVGVDTCCDDYSLKPIQCDQDSYVWVKPT
jgi:hypothetical protein